MAMEDECTNLNLTNDDEDMMEGERIEDDEEDEFELCLVGRVLTESVVHFLSMRRTMAELWHPVGGFQ